MGRLARFSVPAHFFCGLISGKRDEDRDLKNIEIIYIKRIKGKLTEALNSLQQTCEIYQQIGVGASINAQKNENNIDEVKARIAH
jgi:hypothetical protein